jgi:hypothetical protein
VAVGRIAGRKIENGVGDYMGKTIEPQVSASLEPFIVIAALSNGA